MSILDDIADRRRERIANEGAAQGLDLRLAGKRNVPLVPFGRTGGKGGSRFVIAEVKGKSPSSGIIKSEFDPLHSAHVYADAGIRNISVLTEQDYFGGSLEYLRAIKLKYPHMSVLRKDFLLTEEDIDISYSAGADAVLLIASMLDPETLGRLLQKAERLGLTSLVEVHCASEIDSIRSLRPSLVGINSRNLKTFRIDRALPMMLAGLIDWNASLVFESGIQNEEDAAYAYHGGFSGILCGEALMKESSLAGKLVQLAGDFAASGEKASGSKYFWRKLYSGFGAGKNRLKPLVKICGIMEYNDAAAAASLGADMIGFVFADSKRRAEISLPEQLCSIDILKIAVVKNPDAALMDRLRELYEEGFIDAVQYHGKEEPSFCRDAGMPYYKAFSYASASAAPAVPSQRFSCPRFLTDSAADGKEGGTGQNVESSVVDIIRKREALWLAGGISDQNIAYIIDRFSPELVDASSRLEIYPGKKDLKKLENFFRQLNK